jgi:hypothetical protein
MNFKREKQVNYVFTDLAQGILKVKQGAFDTPSSSSRGCGLSLPTHPQRFYCK